MKTPAERIAEMEKELANWKTWGIVEVSVRNASVLDYMKHWEGRTEKAERELALLQLSAKAMREALEFYASKCSYHSMNDGVEAEIRSVAIKALSHPTDTSALDLYVEKAVEEISKRFLDGPCRCPFYNGEHETCCIRYGYEKLMSWKEGRSAK